MAITPTMIYHITNISNIKSILFDKGMFSTNHVIENKIPFTNIAYSNIQDRRTLKYVPVEPFGKLHDYVPFYFSPRSPMLYTINMGNVQGYSGGQKEIVYVVSTVQTIVNAKISFVFTDGHAIMDFTDFYTDIKDLDQIDWNVMTSKFWNDTFDFPDRKRKRQAEFLVFEYFPCSCITGIAVYNNTMKDLVESELQSSSFRIPVHVMRDWYY